MTPSRFAAPGASASGNHHERVAMSAGTQTKPTNPWIVNWWQDLLWFIGPPLFLIPSFFWLMQRVPLERLSLLVISFGAVGHHLPGMLRAYGDRELFQRYRTRFVLAPLFLLAISIAFSFYRPNALAVLVTIWGFWHAQAQIYGFLRIYDAKAGITDRRTALIDRFLCFSWFTGGLVMSSGRMTDFLTIYYRTGGLHIPAEVISGLQYAVLGLMGVSAAAYAANVVRALWRGRSTSLLKTLTLLVSVGFWWYCMVAIRNVILGVALFEVFHDLQYLAIVWFFNRRRASAGPAAGWLTRLIFQPQYRFVLLYVGLVFIYGAGNLFTRGMERSSVQTVLTGLFVASGLLHFYYDGFIWRIRESKTRSALGVASDSDSENPAGLRIPHWLPHASGWTVFCIILLVLGVAPRTEQAHAQVVATLPQSAEAQFNYAAELLKNGRAETAEPHARRAVEGNPASGKAWSLLGEIALAKGDLEGAIDNLTHAIELDPFNAVSYFNLGNARIRRKEIDAATDAYMKAIELDRKLEASSYNNVGVALLESRAYDDAAVAYSRALEADPDNVNALTSLAGLKTRAGDLAAALDFYERALTRQPDHAPAYRGLCRMLMSAGKLEEAEAALQTFAQARPDDPDPFAMLGALKAQQGDTTAAESAFRQALECAANHIPAIYGIAQVQLQQGRFEQSAATIDAALRFPDLTPAHRSNLQQLRRRVLALSPTRVAD